MWQAQEIFKKYYPIEIDPVMPIDKKIPLMREWYSTVHALMLDEGVTKDAIKEAVAKCDSIALRPGMQQLMLHCQTHKPPIPFFIMSAGLGNVIEEFLAQTLPFPMADTTAVVSNQMKFDDEGKLNGFSEPLLHMFNKNVAVLPEDVRERVNSCDCGLLLGDGVGDLTMAQGADLPCLLKIGFLNEKVEERREQYVNGFDIVVTEDGCVPDACFTAVGGSPSSCM